MPSTLIVTRVAGCNSIEPWLLSLAQLSGIDLVPSVYGNEPPDAEGGARYRFPHYFVGGKWSGIYDFFRQYPDLIDAYDYFWFPDDDIESTLENALRFLNIVQQEGFALAQPALAPDSYYAHRITIANPCFSFRRTNFVELMMPLMRRDFLKRVLPLFANRHAALGIDLFWQQLVTSPAREVAIIDATPMGHYRPRQVHLKNNMSRQQINIHVERARTFEELSIRPVAEIILSAVTIEGRELVRGPLLWWTYVRGLAKVRPLICHPRWTHFTTGRLLWSQLLKRPFKPAFNKASYDRLLQNGN